MKTSKLVAFALAGLLLGEPSFAELRVIGQGTNRPAREVSSLVVNTDNSYRTVIKRSEYDGIRDIALLISSSELEEEWIFLPEEQTWYEIGINEKSTKNEYGYIAASCDGDPTGLESILDKQKIIKFYHFHPVDKEATYRQVEPTWNIFSSRVKVDNKAAFYERFAYLFATFQGLPSYVDIRRMSRMILENKKSDTVFSHNVVSVLGVFEYSLTSEGVKVFSDVDSPDFKKELEQFNERYKRLLDRDKFDILGWLQANDHRPYCKRISANLSSSFVKVTYHPFEEYENK